MTTAVTKCFFCGQNQNLLVADTDKDVSLIDGKVINTEPCVTCAEMMRRGVIVIGIDPARTTNPKNPHRSGVFVVISDDGMRKLLKPGKQLDYVLAVRCAFVDHDVLVRCGAVDT